MTGQVLLLAVPIVACVSLLGIPRLARHERGKEIVVGPAAFAFAQLLLGGGLILLGLPFEYDEATAIVLFIPGLAVTGLGVIAMLLAIRMIRRA